MADKKTQFFFDDDDIPETAEAAPAAAAETFFPSSDPVVAAREKVYEDEFTTDKQAIREADMKEMKNAVLELSFGSYQENYGLHITPCHPKRNLSTDRQVFLAIEQAMIIMNEYVPKALRVAINPPMSGWQMKVISFVVENGAAAWNFDIEKFEREGAPRIFEAVQKVILHER